MDRYDPSEYAARVPFPAGIVSYRTASDGGKGDRCGDRRGPCYAAPHAAPLQFFI